MDLQIKIQQVKPGTYNMSAKGRIDSETYRTFDEKVKAELGEKAKNVVFDMSGVNYISSAGLGVVFSLMKKLKEKNGELVLCRLQPQIQKVFDIVKALPATNIFSSTEEADAYIDAIINQELKKQNDND